MIPTIMLNKMDVVLFSVGGKTSNYCQLKKFLNCLNTLNISRPIKFAYIRKEGSLLNNLTLKDNILLDSIPNSLSMTKEYQLDSLLNKTGNAHLIQLFGQIRAINQFPMRVDKQTRKITALIKGMIKESNFLFIEEPQLNLDAESLDLLIKALQYQAKSLGQIIFIHSQDEKFWIQYSTKKITRDDVGRYVITPIINNKGKKPLLDPEVSTEGYLNIVNVSTNKAA